MKKHSFFKEKVCITLTTQNKAHKKPIYIITRKAIACFLALVLLAGVGIGAFAGISAYLSVEALDKSVAYLSNIVEKNEAKLSATEAQAENALAAVAASADDTLPPLEGDETSDTLSSDPWLTIEAAPVAETTEYESGSINGRVELLGWFDGASDIYARHSEADVIDVETGLSFHVRRVGGTYHADSEPLTAEDTQIMRQIVGRWTWDRRAIWVKVGDRYFAASMNAKPHEYDVVSGNNFSGHFCIHFLNSRIHATGKPCDQVQILV